MGRGGRVENNVFFGLDSLTIKGDEHQIISNTGDQMNIITGWARINNMNAKTNTMQNAVTHFYSSGGNGWDMPGAFTRNACSQGTPCKISLDADVCGTLQNCNFEALNEGLVNDLSIFDFRPVAGSAVEKADAGAYKKDDPAPMPGAPSMDVNGRPTKPFPVQR